MTDPHKCTVGEAVLRRDHPDGIRPSHMTREAGTRDLCRVTNMCWDPSALSTYPLRVCTYIPCIVYRILYDHMYVYLYLSIYMCVYIQNSLYLCDIWQPKLYDNRDHPLLFLPFSFSIFIPHFFLDNKKKLKTIPVIYLHIPNRLKVSYSCVKITTKLLFFIGLPSLFFWACLLCKNW
jgi:hypothetical protein